MIMKHSEALKMKKWINKIIKLQKKLCKIQDFSDDLKICTGNAYRFQIYNNIEDLAKALGKDITIQNRNDETYPIEKSFSYKGITIFQIEEAK